MKLKWGRKEDNEWLEKKYLIEKLSTIKIAKLCYSGCSTIWRWLHKLNIPTRSISESQHLSRGNHCYLSIEAIHWINGELLGDGCLQKTSAYSTKYFLEYIGRCPVRCYKYKWDYNKKESNI